MAQDLSNLGYVFSTKLLEKMKPGLVYTVEAMLDTGKTALPLRFFMRLIRRMWIGHVLFVERDLGEMQRELVAPEELNRAKTLLIRQSPLSESSTDAIAEKLLHLSLEDLPFDEPVRAAQKYKGDYRC